jgi:hypothetical protein
MGQVKNRIGEKFTTSKGLEIEIVEYIGASNVTVKFLKDGAIRTGVYMTSIRNGNVQHPNRVVLKNPLRGVNRLGEKWKSNEGSEFEIIEYLAAANCTIKFEDGTIVKNQQYVNISSGKISNPNLILKSVYGVGFNTGEIHYPSNDNPIYACWHAMLQRCYSGISQFSPAYDNCSVIEEWQNLQNFAKWYIINYIDKYQLDKDILIKGNKIYGPDTCCFVPQDINKLFTKVNSARGPWPIGVSLYPKNGINKYGASANRDGQPRTIGYYATPEEAFEKYKEAKEAYIKEVANRWKNHISDNVYQALMRYEVEITD